MDNTIFHLAGIACITLTFVDATGHPLQTPASDCGKETNSCSTPLQPEHFERLTTVLRVKTDSVHDGWSQGEALRNVWFIAYKM